MLLGHRQVAAPEAGLDVREEDTRGLGCTRARESRVGVAVDQHQVGPLRLDQLVDRRPHHLRVGRLESEPMVGLGEAELLEEDL